MQRDFGAWKLSEHNHYEGANKSGFTCDECGETFPKPILATVSGSGDVQSYYACPRCMTKVQDTMMDRKLDRQEESSEAPVVQLKKLAAKCEDESVKCAHSFGYLKKRSKDVAIPEECLTCSKMVECLLH